jgi:hypothetical protein
MESVPVSSVAVLVSSNLTNTIITSPPNTTVVIDTIHIPNFISYNAQWLWRAGAGDTVVFQSSFYASSTSPATLLITADDIFSASLNGGIPFTGSVWNKIFQFTLNNLTCGINTLNITAINKGGPAGLIFAVTQDQTDSFKCASPLSFYNPNTCQC